MRKFGSTSRTSFSKSEFTLGSQGATPISNILGDLLARRWWFPLSRTPKHAYNSYATKSTHIRQVTLRTMRKEISFEVYLVYPVPTSGAIAKGHETPNPNKQEASTPPTILNPLNNPKKGFPSSSATPTTSHLPSKWVLEESLPQLMILMMTSSRPYYNFNMEYSYPNNDTSSSRMNWPFITRLIPEA